MLRRRFVLSAIFLLAQVGLAVAEPPPCPGRDAENLCLCRLEELQPTQVSLGWLHVQDILRDPPSKLQEHAMSQPTQVVLGPSSALYVTDGHHHARAALAQLREGIGRSTTICRIVGDASGAPVDGREAFLAWLAERHQARLNGGDEADGVVRPGIYPPASLEGMTNDSYRSLASFVEAACGFKMDGDFGEFPLADLLRRVKIPAPTDLAHKRDQGRMAATTLVANTDPVVAGRFRDLPHHMDIESCARSP